MLHMWILIRKQRHHDDRLLLNLLKAVYRCNKLTTISRVLLFTPFLVRFQDNFLSNVCKDVPSEQNFSLYCSHFFRIVHGSVDMSSKEPFDYETFPEPIHFGDKGSEPINFKYKEEKLFTYK